MISFATTFNSSTALSGLLQPNRGLTSAVWMLLRRLTGHPPAVSSARDPVREAAAVREMADSIRSTDPRFAADLYAAADHHEQIYAGTYGSNAGDEATRACRIER